MPESSTRSFIPNFAWPANSYADIAESRGLQLLPGDPDLHVRIKHEQLDVLGRADGLLLSHSREAPVPQVERTANGSSGVVELERELPCPFVVTPQGSFVHLDDSPEVHLELERRRNPFGEWPVLDAEFQRHLEMMHEMDSFPNVQLRAARYWQHLIGDYLGLPWEPGETRRLTSETLGCGASFPKNVIVRTITYAGDVDYERTNASRAVRFTGQLSVDTIANSTVDEYAIFDAATMQPLETGMSEPYRSSAPRGEATASLPLERIVTRRRYSWYLR